MNIQQLEYVIALDTYRNFVKAAEKCHVTQATLSMMIKKLEEPRFLEAFLEKGRLRSVLETVQIKVIMNDKTALLGAARCALMHAGIFHHVGAV